MTLVVEDGTGVSGADSFASRTEANAYWAAHGAPASWTALSDEAKDAEQRFGARWLSETYAGRWKGWITHEHQEMRWPRSGVVDDEGRVIEPTEIPRALKEAQFHAGQLHREGGGLAAVTKSGIKREELVDVVEREFFSPSGSTPQNAFIDSLLSGLLASPAGLLVTVRG